MMSAADDTATDRALRGLDAAAPELEDDQRRRADATLSRILATDPGVPAPLSGTAPQRRHRRVLLAGGLVAAAATVAVVVPVVVGGDGAFASWSPTPTELTGAARRAAVDACLVLQGDEEGPLAFDPGADAAVLVAESRGGWSYVLYRVESASGGELEGSCLVPESLVDDPRPAGEASSGASVAPTRVAGRRRRATRSVRSARVPGASTARRSSSPRAGPARTWRASSSPRPVAGRSRRRSRTGGGPCGGRRARRRWPTRS